MTILSIFMFLAVSVLPVEAQDASFTASVEPASVAMGEQLRVTFTLSGTGGGTEFQPPTFANFLVLSGPNQSTSMQVINGAMSSSVSYSYILQPRSEGRYTIGPASITHDGKKLQTKPLAVTVAKSNQALKQQSRQTAPADITKQIAENLFLRVTVDRSRVYQGEQVTVTYRIFTRVSVVNYSITKVPSLTGFWSEDLDIPKQIQLTNEVVDGKQYRVGILKKAAVFPQRNGTLELDPMEVECVVQVQNRRRSNDIFDQFFNDPFFGNVTNVNHKVRSEPLRITVLPLPSENVPAGFSGAVGSYSMQAWLDKEQTKTNDPVTFRIKITGRGNLKLLNAPAFVSPSDFDRYDPKITDDISRQGDKITGSRTFEYLLIPRHPGDQRITSFPFSYFDPEKRSFVTLKSNDFRLAVEKGADIAAGAASGLTKEDIRLLGEDIRFIKSGGIEFARRGDVFFGSPMFFILSGAPVIAFIGFLLLLRRRQAALGDTLTMRNRRARKTARRRLYTAKMYLGEKKREEFYAELSRALWGYVADKIGLAAADLSLESVRTALKDRGVNPTDVEKFLSLLEQCEFARFAPASDSHQLEGSYESALNMISAIEGQIR